MHVGVLALQGDVREHEAVIERLGGKVSRITTPADFVGIDGLILPGGESTTMSKLLDSSGTRHLAATWVAENRPTLGTCAGLVLLAEQLDDGRKDQVGLGGLAITVQRNGYGRQRFSFESVVIPSDGSPPFDAVFIRSPRITAVGDEVSVLGNLMASDGEVVLVQQGSIIGCAFHPELTGDTRIHERFLALVGETQTRG